MAKLVQILAVALLAGLMVFPGCAKPTKESKTNGYKAARDKLQALSTKDPKLKSGIDAKLAEFDMEFKEAEKKEGEEAVKAIGAIVSRMNKYHESLAPKSADKAGAKKPAAPGAKAKPTPEQAKAAADKAAAEAKAKAASAKPKAPTPPATGHPAAPTGGKLGGTKAPAAAPAAPAAKPTGGSGFGGK